MPAPTDSRELEPLDRLLQALMIQLTPASRKELARHIARSMRKANAARIRAQEDPDGAAFAPRRPDTYRPSFRHSKKLRRAIMRKRVRRKLFAKLQKTSSLRANWSESEASVGFNNPTTARIASVHHYGLRDRVYRKGGLTADYPERRLLGFAAADREEVIDLVMRHIEEGT